MFHQVLSFSFPFLDILFHVTWWAVLLLFLQKILDIYIVFHTLTHHSSWFTTPQFLCFITMMQSAVFCLPADCFQSSNISLWFCRQDWTPQKTMGCEMSAWATSLCLATVLTWCMFKWSCHFISPPAFCYVLLEKKAFRESYSKAFLIEKCRKYKI